MGERELPFDVTPERVRSTGSMLGDRSRFTPEWVIPLTFLFLLVPVLCLSHARSTMAATSTVEDFEGPGL